MSYHPQASGFDRSHNGHRTARSGDRRSPPSSAASSSREPVQKRPRINDVKPTSARGAANSGSASSAGQGGRPGQSNLEDVQDVNPDLDRLLDQLDAGMDEEEQRRRTLEESRKRRQAILQKHSSSQVPTPSDQSGFSLSHPASEEPPVRPDQVSVAETNGEADSKNVQTAFSLRKSASQDFPVRRDDAGTKRASAAELDPDADRAQELARLEQRRQSQLQRVTKELNSKVHEEDFEEVEVTDEEDAELDMFALSDDEGAAKKKKTKIIRMPKHRDQRANLVNATKALPLSDAVLSSTANLASNWDDSEGYLRTILGETLDERYQIFAVLGKGMFASVVRARDLHDNGREVAIKIIRVQESMYKAGLKEVGILRKLNESDPDDRKRVVRLERHFDYKGHLCMVFESLAMNLREVVRRYGRDVGLNLQAVRAYAHQLLLSLSHLAKNSVIHADIKPDNVLVNDTKTLLKLCDLGSASFLHEMEITPYLVSRFYRAPEIILGQAYDCSIDVWSTGCTLYELATGKILFPGRTNNHMLLLMQELRGRFTTKQIRKSQFGEQHFDDANAFLSMEPDKSTGQSVVRRMMLQRPVMDLRARLLPADAAKQLKAEELKTTNHFVDFLERCLELDPAKRIKPKDALEHPFLAHVSRSG